MRTIDKKRFDMACLVAGVERKTIAAELEISRQTLWQRLAGKKHFREVEIKIISKLLNVEDYWLVNAFDNETTVF